MSLEANASVQPLSVDLCGIIRIFGKALYNEFGAIVRELVQNGHDTVVESFRASLANKPLLSEFWVNVKYNQLELVVSDNGVGMNHAGIADQLNNFGRAKKRLEENDAGPGQGPAIIGLYGVGFLAAMAVSERVDVWTRTANDPPIHWWYEHGQISARTEIPPLDELGRVRKAHGLLHSDPQQPGTVVICRLSDKIREDYEVDEESVKNSLVRYARLLRVPVYFNGNQISNQLAGWADRGHQSDAAWKEMIKDITGDEPLLVIPVSSPADQLDLEGVLWIPPRGSILGENGHIDLYVRRMFVLQDYDKVRPGWARFIMGMVNSNKLNPIVSRAALIEDRVLSETRDFIKGQILAAFDRLTQLSEDEYWAVVGGHDDIIKLSAAESDELLDRVWDKLRVRVGVRRMTLPEYITEVSRRTERTDVAYYYERTNQQFAAAMVSDAAGIPVLSLWTLNDKGFVEAVCARRKIELRPYTELAAAVIKKPDNEAKYLPLMTACAAKKIAADVREYNPAHIPAMLVEDGSLEMRLQQLLRMLRESGSPQDGAVAGQLQNAFLRQQALNRGVSFYLNAANPLIQELLDAPFDTQQETCLALYNVSYLSVAPQLQRAEVQAIYDSLCKVLRNLVEQTRPKAPPPKCRPIRLFMITPFAPEYQLVEAAVREVFENPPYFFEVVLARDFGYKFTLLDDLRAHMSAADGFVAELSDLNPNVMIEFGAAILGEGASRPMIAMRRAGAKDMPADIRGVLYIGYDMPGTPVEKLAEADKKDAIAAIAAAIRAKIELNKRPTNEGIVELTQRQICKALTRTLLTSTHCRCRDDEADKILEKYRTIEQLLDVLPSDIQRVTGVPEAVATLVQTHLKPFDHRPAAPSGPAGT